MWIIRPKLTLAPDFISALVTFLGLMILHPASILVQHWTRNRPFWSISLPTTWDPAPILYPTFLPILVALSLGISEPPMLRTNLILGISCLPSKVLPHFGTTVGMDDPLHWLLTLMPLFLPSLISPGSQSHNIQEQFQGSIYGTFTPEDLSLLFPLHSTLLAPIRYATATSLLPAESQLLSVVLINMLLFSTSPPSTILGIIIWIGGLGVFLFCAHPLKWNVALERIPRMRFKNAGRLMSTAQSFLSALAEGLNSGNQSRAVHESDDEDGQSPRAVSSNFQSHRVGSKIPHGSPGGKQVPSSNAARQTSPHYPKPRAGRHSRSISDATQSYLSLTHDQARTRKMLYTTFTYTVMILLIFGPIRSLIKHRALAGYDPFGWAVGYLFGGIDPIRYKIGYSSLNGWVPLPASAEEHLRQRSSDRASFHGLSALGFANTRLLLFAYWAGVISFGLGIVLGLSKSVDVDTRRKVFHGTMVLMLLPTAYVDPAYLHLGFSIVLSVFLILELFRAAQLRPFSQPLARFLAPYVDGRDLRGPVVVSHIFLLIGCAIPFWLSLAGTRYNASTKSEPFGSWEVQTRDVSMVAGVVCVGMGDAAASLVGRRFGRHKWPWAGGKSLEGSAAFSISVLIGLLAARGLLWLGEWTSTFEREEGVGKVVLKAFLAATGASFTEAVLTGCNDNVVVPVILWLYVRSLRL